MALFYMSIQFYISLFLGAVCILPLFFKNGAMIKNKFVCGFIALVTLFLGIINYTSIPDNYLLQKVVVSIVVVMVEVGLLINNKYAAYDKVSKALIALGLIGNILILAV